MKTAKAKRASSVVRRSFALPKDVLEKAVSLAPKELQGNLNRLVRTALEAFIVQQKRRRFAEGWAAMVKDSQAMAVERQLNEEFSVTDADGLS